MSTHTLYLCYFGLREPLVQTQVLPYLREIAKGQIKVSLLTFEPQLKRNWNSEQIAAERKNLAAGGISWHYLPYHKKPSLPATAYDIMNGARYVLSLMRRENINVLHARGHLPIPIALLAKKLRKNSRVIFDIRGLLAEEYVDGKIWTENSKGFRIVKNVERLGLKNADQVVVLTNKMRDYLVENNLKPASQIEVIPCCMDFSRISQNKENAAVSERFELIYAGSTVGLYLLEEMGRFFLELKKFEPKAFFRILTITSPEKVIELFRRIGISETDFAAQSVSPAQVPNIVKQANLAISFRTPTFSQIAASPTKIPEYLSVGVPVVANAGIGDMDTLIEREKVGVIVENFDQPSLSQAAARALELLKDESLAERCVETARENFDLIEVGGKHYLNVYKRIAESLR